jgi:hypothetical protein
MKIDSQLLSSEKGSVLFCDVITLKLLNARRAVPAHRRNLPLIDASFGKEKAGSKEPAFQVKERTSF